MNNFWKKVLIRITDSIIVFFAFLIFAILYVSSLAKENAITLGQGILVFAISILIALILISVIWVRWRAKYGKKRN